MRNRARNMTLSFKLNDAYSKGQNSEARKEASNTLRIEKLKWSNASEEQLLTPVATNSHNKDAYDE